MKKFKKGDKVKIVSCEMHPQYVGKTGEIKSVVSGMDGITLYKVSCDGKTIPNYATDDCLKKEE